MATFYIKRMRIRRVLCSEVVIDGNLIVHQMSISVPDSVDFDPLRQHDKILTSAERFDVIEVRSKK
jgi:hypothetical protein